MSRHLKNCRLAIFDWNGTLKDDLWIVIESVRLIFKHYKAAIPPDLGKRYREEITANFKEFYYKYGVPRSVTPEEMSVKRGRFLAKHKQSTRLRDNAKKTLTVCRGLGTFQLSIVSAEIASVLKNDLDRFDIKEHFEKVWADVRNKHDALAAACEYFKVKPSRAFYVDDTVEGIEASSDCGLIPVSLVTSTSYTPEKFLRKAAQERNAIIITDLFEIAQLI